MVRHADTIISILRTESVPCSGLCLAVSLPSSPDSSQLVSGPEPDSVCTRNVVCRMWVQKGAYPTRCLLKFLSIFFFFFDHIRVTHKQVLHIPYTL